MKYIVFTVTMMFLFHLSHGGVRKFKSDVDSVKIAPHARRRKTAASPKKV
jgi:succinate dehydrogenase/fumarate reductase cytochrome b subunit